MRTSELVEGDFNPYYKPYIGTLGEVDLMEMLRKQLVNFPQFIASIPEGKWHSTYAEGKWTIAEALVHILDAERVFQYRALRFARKDQTPLPGFDQDAYVPVSGANSTTKDSMIEEYRIIRGSTIALFSGFDEEVLRRRGTASNSEVTVGALGFIICGHQRHHKLVIKERYLKD